MKNESEKQQFAARLKAFAMTLTKKTTFNNEWAVKGFIDVFEHIYTISSDTKVISKVLELQLFPEFLAFAKCFKYKIELTSQQNYYPDLTFISENDPSVKFAVDLKTTYRDEMCADFCRGFTLGSHGEYFIDRTSRKNIQYPYDEYSGHFCLGIIYTKSELENRIATLTGGRAAEEVEFGQVTTGASNDIEQATKIARAMITRYGMSDEFDMVAMETVNNKYLGGDASLACSDGTASTIDQKVVALVKQQHEKAKQLLTEHKADLDRIAQFLYQKETITGEEFMEILEKKEDFELPAVH